nr:MAG TPA: hypothetical protein [Microviridae sp.]
MVSETLVIFLKGGRLMNISAVFFSCPIIRKMTG